MVLGSCSLVRAQPGPGVKAPEICDLEVTLDSESGSVVVTWSGGTSPFLIVRGDAPRFDRAAQLDWIAERAMGHRHVDSSARKPGRRYYYQVYDNFSARELFSGPEHAHDSPNHDEGKHADEKPPPDNNYCKGVLRRAATWK
jgi:hypothetical protein